MLCVYQLSEVLSVYVSEVVNELGKVLGEIITLLSSTPMKVCRHCIFLALSIPTVALLVASCQLHVKSILVADLCY